MKSLSTNVISTYIVNSFTHVKQKGFFHLFVSSILVKIIGFGSQFFVAWWLTTEQIGEIKIIQTYFSLASIIVLFGFNSSILKLCSENRPLEQIVGLYKKGRRYVTISFFIIFPIILLLIFSGLISPNKKTSIYLMLVLIGLYPTVMNECDAIYLQARKQIKLLSLRQVFSRSISILLIVILTYLFGFNGYIVAFIVSSLIAYVIFIILIKRVNIDIVPYAGKSPFMDHWNYSKFAIVTLVLGQLSSFADVYLMNFLIDDKNLIGLYSFALLLILIPTIFSSTIQQIFVPYVSNVSQSIFNIKNIYRKYQNLNIVSSLFITILSILILPAIVNLIFGIKYSKSIPLFFILIAAWFINNLSLLKGYILLGIGLIKFNLYVSIIITCIKFLICFLFTKKIGIYGLALGVLISNSIGIIVIQIAYKLGIKKHERALCEKN